MAWIEKRRRGDSGVAARVIWRLGGTRDGAKQVETFSAGTDAQNLARADGFKKMVDAAGQYWPEGWVKGEGFVRPKGESDPLTAPPRFDVIGGTYVRQIVDLSPGQRKRYLGQLKVLASTRIRGSGIWTWRSRGPTRVVACSASQPMISLAARSCAASCAAAISGWRAATSDQDLGPLVEENLASREGSGCGGRRGLGLALAQLCECRPRGIARGAEAVQRYQPREQRATSRALDCFAGCARVRPGRVVSSSGGRYMPNRAAVALP